MNISPEPLVSVLVITYNHGKYVRQALESILAQRTSFPFEIVVGEDCSRDDTREIVHATLAGSQVPSTVLERTGNLGMLGNFVDTLSRCRGKYVAMLEGDDWWSDAEKLERQVAVLEADPKLAFCFHRVRWINQREHSSSGWAEGHEWPAKVPSPVNFDSIASEVFIQTGSVVFRRALQPLFPDWLRALPWVDWYLFLELARRGSVAFLPETMSAYRQHPQGAIASMDTLRIHDAASSMFTQLARELDRPFSTTCRKMQIKHLMLLADEQEKLGHLALARHTLFRATIARARTASMEWRTLAWLARLTLPSLHRFVVRLRGIR